MITSRASGVLLHISSLPGEYGEGSLGREAREFVDLLAAGGFSVWQVLPLCPPDPFASPYKSPASFAGNPAFVDLPTLREAGLLTAEELAAERQTSPFSCEFARLASSREETLARAAQRAFADPALALELDRFAEENPRVDLACRFLARRKAEEGKPWQLWRYPARRELTKSEMPAYRAALFTQVAFFTQWRRLKDYAAARGVRILGDLPFYVDGDSADVWERPRDFLLDEQGRPTAVAGVPPDYFSPEGQMWGNPLYDWEEMASGGYRFWRERIAAMLSHFDGLRIDHFRALESYFAVPAGARSAREGEWRRGPGQALLDALLPLTAGKILVAEDLGDITPAVRDLAARNGLPGMRVLQFAFLGDARSPHLPHNYERNCVAYTGTHDNNTLLGYVWSLPEETRRRLFSYVGYEGEDLSRCYDPILRTMLASSAGWVIFPVQDLLLFGEDTRMNRPGVRGGNWSYRVTRAQLEGIDWGKFAAWNRLYDRT